MYCPSFKIHQIFRTDDQTANPSKRVLNLLLINLTLTFFMELVWRESFAKWGGYSHQTRFFVPLLDGGYIINRQSLINLAMTGIATLVGSWVLFGRTRRNRFFAFIFSGLVIAAVAQFTVNILTGAAVVIGLNRIAFDLFYTCTFKFPMFEWGRKALIASHASIFVLFAVRFFQDATMSAIRIGLLNQFQIY